MALSISIYRMCILEKDLGNITSSILYSMKVHFKPKEVGNAREYCTCLLLGHRNRFRGRIWCLFDTTALQLRCYIPGIVV